MRLYIIFMILGVFLFSFGTGICLNKNLIGFFMVASGGLLMLLARIYNNEDR